MIGVPIGYTHSLDLGVNKRNYGWDINSEGNCLRANIMTFPCYGHYCSTNIDVIAVGNSIVNTINQDYFTVFYCNIRCLGKAIIDNRGSRNINRYFWTT